MPLQFGSARSPNDGAPRKAFRLVKSVPTTTGVVIGTYQLS